MGLSGKPVLVTGAGGFIGSHLAERLVGDGAQVRAFVHYNALGSRGWLDRSPLVSQMEVVSGDVADRDSVRSAMLGVEVIFHLAAPIGIPYSYEVPASYVRVNVGGAVNVLQSARDLGVERVIHTSTSEVYGTARFTPITEDHPLQAQSPYSASKIGADKMAESFHASFGVPVVTVRPFNTYGPRQSTRAVVPTIITQCLAGGPIRLGNLSPTRDLNYVHDTVVGCCLAAVAPDALGQVVNLGSGKEVNIGDLAALLCELCGAPLDLVAEEQRTRGAGGDGERLMADSSRAQELLHWRSSVSLRQGLAETVEWFRENVTLYGTGEYAV